MISIIKIRLLFQAHRLKNLMALACLLFIFCSQNLFAGADEKKLLMLKAVMVIKFFKYTEWPENNQTSDADNNYLKLCVHNSPILLSAFKTIEGKKIGRKVLQIKSVSKEDVLPESCHILYVDELNTALFTRLNQGKKAILTISDQKGFALEGGMIELTIRKTHLSFNINYRQLTSANLMINSAVLELAKQIIK